LSQYYKNIVLLLCLLVLGCKQETIIHIKQRHISSLFVSEVHKKAKPQATLYINSAGGKTLAALDVAEIIMSNNMQIIIDKECMSVCSEFLLPAASSVILQDAPLIGFHWNPIMLLTLMEEHARQDLQFCDRRTSDGQRKLYMKTGHNIEFWQQTLIRLELLDYKIEYRPQKCPRNEITFYSRIWLPTSQQLRDLYKLEFTGSVCADDYEACVRRVNSRWKKGTRIVIGDVTYVSNGHK